jgi:hypothetical protein
MKKHGLLLLITLVVNLLASTAMAKMPSERERVEYEIGRLTALISSLESTLSNGPYVIMGKVTDDGDELIYVDGQAIGPRILSSRRIKIIKPERGCIIRTEEQILYGISLTADHVLSGTVFEEGPDGRLMEIPVFYGPREIGLLQARLSDSRHQLEGQKKRLKKIRDRENATKSGSRTR